jgi:hypothetical protein
MFRTARRPVGTLALLLLLAPSIAGCLSTQHIPYTDSSRLDNVTGVTMRSGREIRFSQPGAQIRNDTLYAVVRQNQVTLPTDSIAQVTQQKASPWRSTLLMYGLIGGALAIIVFSKSTSNGIVGFP